jgi:restriction system protein
LLIPAPFSAFAALIRQKRLATQRAITSIRDLDRWQLEQLVAETYRRRGYTVKFERDDGQDGRVDLRLQKGGRLQLLQCRHWQSLTVDISDVQELFEAMNAERAAAIVVITSGTFTAEVKKFAVARPIQLIGLEQLAAFINDG